LTDAIDDLITLGHMEAYTMNRQQISELYEELEIEKERTERAERMKRLAAEEEAKKEAELKAETSAASLINDLMSDEEDEEGDRK
jgi:hypothetical protein